MRELQPGIHCATLYPEWAHAVAWLGKPIENRKGKPWARLIGERVGVHAGAHIGGRPGRPALREGSAALQQMAKRAGVEIDCGGFVHPCVRKRGGLWTPVDTSAIICTAVIAKCEMNEGQEPPPWASPLSPYWWHLADVEVLPVPVPCKGKQGFWRWTP